MRVKSGIGLVILTFALYPCAKLLYVWGAAVKNSLVLEIASKDKKLSRYVLANNAQNVYHHTSKIEDLEPLLGDPSLEDFYDAIHSQYGIPEANDSVRGGKFRSSALPSSAVMEKFYGQDIDPSIPLLGSMDSDVIGDLRKFKILHRFDDIGKVHTVSVRESIADSIAMQMDLAKASIPSGKETEMFFNSKFLDRTFKRDWTSLQLENVRDFLPSPQVLFEGENSLTALQNLALVSQKTAYYSFEIIRYNLVATSPICLDDLKVYVTRNGYILPNVGGKNDYFLKYRDKIIYGTAALGYNPPPGIYTIEVRSISQPDWPGISTTFELYKRRVPSFGRSMSIVNMEYTAPLGDKKIRTPTGEMSNYKAIADWIEFMEADSFWMLAAQTTGWDAAINETNPWVKGGLDNLKLLAPEMKKRNIDVGAYIMAYYSPANGKAKAGYATSWSYDRPSGNLKNSSHISLLCPKRLRDITKMATLLEQDPLVSFIGLDFIRTGQLDGYEMGPIIVDDMNIRTPADYMQFSEVEKIRWFANQISVRRNDDIIKKWRWWRATKTASIVNKIITDGKITKPLWVFTLGWEHGKQHGQDPYMMFDAGVFADSVMLYESDQNQFRNMMIQWPQYMRNNQNNIFIGNATDVRLLDSSKRNIADEYVYRSVQGYQKIYRKGLAKGVFCHDISRMLWSSKRGLRTIEWGVVSGHVFSKFRQEHGEIPYSINISFDPKNRKKGFIEVVNLSMQNLEDLSIVHIPTGSWHRVQDNIPSSFQLRAGESVRFAFQADLVKGIAYRDNILAYKGMHPKYRSYISFTQLPAIYLAPPEIKDSVASSAKLPASSPSAMAN